MNYIKKLIFDLFKLMEKGSTHFLGKGYGSTTIKQEVKMVCSEIEKLKIAVDIGGNKGLYTQCLLDVNDKIQVTIFEPSRLNTAILRSKFAHKNIVINGCGLSSKNETVTLYSDIEGSGLASLTKRNLQQFGVDFERVEEIDVIRFDSYWQRKMQRVEIDLMKIDVEGHEMDVLIGAGDAIEHTKLIQFEFGGCNIDTRTYMKDFWQFFSEKQFELMRMTPFGLFKIEEYDERMEYFLTTNYLAKNMRYEKAIN